MMSRFGQSAGRGIAAVALIGGFVGSGHRMMRRSWRAFVIRPGWRMTLPAVVLLAGVGIVPIASEAGGVTAAELGLLAHQCPAPVYTGTTATVTCSYNGTTGSDGSAQSWTVPAGVTQATFDVYGAQGGGSAGGTGGEAEGTFAVTAGSVFQIEVGGQPSGAAAGYNGGGIGGGVSSTGGGGASDVRDGAYGLSDRIVVAGGGGGGGGGNAVTLGGGEGGGVTGASGTPDLCSFANGSCNGGGGTSSSGGTAGAAQATCDPAFLLSSTLTAATPGESGVGGNGSSISCTEMLSTGGNATDYMGGGGGGGGWFGGGGGWALLLTSSVNIQAGAPGGGGSGYLDPSATNPTMNTGVQSGNGEVVITYQVPACPAPVISGDTATVTCSYNGIAGSDGSAQSWTVPAGVTQATFNVYGAQGGGSSGGNGGEATGTFAVAPGSTFQVNVGGQPLGTAGGFNGGGGGSQGGGGASDIRNGAFGLADRLVVAGGGGGAGSPAATGGSGGGGDGAGYPDPGGQCVGTCGGGATTAQGGAAAANICSSPFSTSLTGTDPTAGTSGVGGNGGSMACTILSPVGNTTQDASGAGGGGGWFGGGGGGGLVADNVVGDGPGGGGSGHIDGLAANPSTQLGVNSGNGNVVITYTVDNDLVVAPPSAPVTANATGPSGAVVNYAPVVSDPDDTSPPAVTCTQSSGATFPIGTTMVTCTASDSDDANSPQTTSFTVTVFDTDLSIATNSNISTPATGPSGAAVNFAAPAAGDEGGESPLVTCNRPSGSTFSVGTTTVTCTASDSDDTVSSVTSTFTVTVVAPPSLSIAFGATSVPLGGQTTLTYTITNPNPSTALTGVGFSDTLPAGLVVSTPSGGVTDCANAAATAVSGSSSVSLSGVTVPVGNPACFLTLNVTGEAVGTQVNTTSAITSNEGGVGNKATASITIVENDLAVAPPSSPVTANATGPSGAAVKFAPVVSDPDDPSPPAATCTSQSGSTFAIGQTTVTCSVSDSDDANSPQTTSFTVTVVGAAGQLTALQKSVSGVGPGVSFSDKLAQAQSYLAAKDTKDTCSTLMAFINEVEAALSKKAAAPYVASATEIRAVLGC